jgi:hypothetical protein
MRSPRSIPGPFRSRLKPIGPQFLNQRRGQERCKQEQVLIGAQVGHRAHNLSERLVAARKQGPDVEGAGFHQVKLARPRARGIDQHQTQENAVL